MWDLWAINKLSLKKPKHFLHAGCNALQLSGRTKNNTRPKHVSFLKKKQASKADLQKKRKSLIYKCNYLTMSPTLLIQFSKRRNQATRSLQTNAITGWLNKHWLSVICDMYDKAMLTGLFFPSQSWMDTNQSERRFFMEGSSSLLLANIWMTVSYSYF